MYMYTSYPSASSVTLRKDISLKKKQTIVFELILIECYR